MKPPPELAFKGGTSLSKIYNTIDRFSEDVDVTVDYSHFNPSFDPTGEDVGTNDHRRQKEALQEQLSIHLKTEVLPFFKKNLKNLNLKARCEIKISTDNPRNLELFYTSVIPDITSNSEPYLKERVLIEFGTGNQASPTEEHKVVPYISKLSELDEFVFPMAKVNVLKIERTF